MIITAFDPGDRNFGWASTDGHHGIQHGVYVTKKEHNQWERIDEIIDYLVNQYLLPEAFGGDAVIIIEEGYRRAALIRLIGYLRGWIERNGNTVVVVKPAQWPKDLWGKKKSGQYKECAMKLAKQEGCNPKTQHEADAISLCYWFQHHGQKI